MEKIRKFLSRKDIVLSGRRYGIDALGAMAQGLFCTLLVGTILNTLGQQFDIGFLSRILVTVTQGVGTSMLQMPNIIKNPKIWIPPIPASAVTGPWPPACSNCR